MICGMQNIQLISLRSYYGAPVQMQPGVSPVRMIGLRKLFADSVAGFDNGSSLSIALNDLTRDHS